MCYVVIVCSNFIVRNYFLVDSEYVCINLWHVCHITVLFLTEYILLAARGVLRYRILVVSVCMLYVCLSDDNRPGRQSRSRISSAEKRLS